MKIIDDDNVRVLVEQSDKLPRNGKETLLKILLNIYENTGMNFLDSRITVETVRGANGAYYLSIAKLADRAPASYDQTEKADEDMYLFELFGPENIFDAAAVFRKAAKIRCGASKMYKYRGKYYLAVYFPPDSVSGPQFGKLLQKLSKYCTKCKWSIMNEAMLEEWAELIADDPLKTINTASQV